MVERIVSLAENLLPIALIGAGGIGKTSIALTVLHHDRIKKRYGVNRRFIRCDQFPASRTHFLARLSKVIGAGVENPEDLAPLRPLLSSKEMFIVLDNAESILDPQGTNSQDIYAVIDELCQFKTICLCITSRIATVPRYCKRPQIPTLSMQAACEIFYGIYGDGGPSYTIDNLLRRLDFHALSITLLATTASDNSWDFDRLGKEWDERRAQVLRTDHNESLAATIELSLASPTFRKLGPNARDLLGVVASLPQGVAETNLEWFFPMICDRKNIFDKFCLLSLTYKIGGFITMLAPIRDHLRPQDPTSSPLLCATKGCYLTRLSVGLDPGQPGFDEAQWIKSEDTNVEHLLDVFTSTNTNAFDIWDACVKFMRHLYWHKPRQTVLGPKIEGLPNDHPYKLRCLFELSQLFGSVGNYAEQKRLLIRTLTLSRECRDDSQVAQTLRSLSRLNLELRLRKEGIQQAEEALETYKQVGDMIGQADCLHVLAWLLLHDDQLDIAEDAALRSINLLLEQSQDYLLCKSHHVLGVIHQLKGDKEKAIDNFETALGIARPFNWQGIIFWIHHDVALLYSSEGELGNANDHIKRAMTYTADDPYKLGRARHMQAWIWYRQCRLEDARSEALCVVEIYEKLGAAWSAGKCRELLRSIEQKLEHRFISDTGGEFSGYRPASHPR